MTPWCLMMKKIKSSTFSQSYRGWNWICWEWRWSQKALNIMCLFCWHHVWGVMCNFFVCALTGQSQTVFSRELSWWTVSPPANSFLVFLNKAVFLLPGEENFFFKKKTEQHPKALTALIVTPCTKCDCVSWQTNVIYHMSVTCGTV